MAMIAAKCTQCGANIQVDDTKEAGICESCGTAFVTEKAINNYNTYVTNNNNFSGANINVTSDNLEQLVERAETFIRLEEFNKAENVYKEIIEKYPMDYRGWLGKVIAETKNFSNITTSGPTHWFISENFEKAIKVAKPTEQESILKQKQEYERLYKQEIDRDENSKYNASICNLYDYRDVEEALGCKLLSREWYEFLFFTYVLDHTVKYEVSYIDYNGEKNYSAEEVTCSVCVEKNNLEELLSGYVKKDDSTKENGNSGCYIATCVYGSYDCPQVWTLRRFRDYTLDETWYGRLFIKCYYAISPTLVKWFGNQKWFRTFFRTYLDLIIQSLNKRGVDDTKYQDKY